MRRILWCVLACVGVAGSAYAQSTTARVSVSSTGTEGNNSSSSAAISADGRYVAFTSFASNLVPGDTNGVEDVFVRDRQTGTTERVNLGPNNVQAEASVLVTAKPVMSADGRFVAFVSAASNLVAGDTNGKADIFVRDRQAGTTTRVSVGTGGVQSSGNSVEPAISADGRYVVFRSTANLIATDIGGAGIFRHDRQTGTTVRVSVTINGLALNSDANEPSISANGRFVAFESAASNLVAGDTNNYEDVFVRDMDAGTTSRVSIPPGGGQSNMVSFLGTISNDGRFVVFNSLATNLDPAGGQGVFIHDRQSGVTSPLAVNPAGSPGAAFPEFPAISADGGSACFVQRPPAGGNYDVFIVDRRTLVKTPVTVTATGDPANKDSNQCMPNADGSMVAFTSSASNLVVGDTNDRADVFVRTFASTLSIDKAALTFAAVTNGTSFVSQTGTQVVRLTQAGSTPAMWTAASNQSWLHVDPASGVGSATLSISVAPSSGLPASGSVTGTIFISSPNAANTLPPIAVTLTLVPNGTSTLPFGTVDTPGDHRTGVTGAIPFTGWALDDVEVTRVSICRAAFGSEVAPIDPNCGGAAEIFVGFAVFIDGARPDVAGAFATNPLSARAGWGFMVLTNMLPNQGNGTYTFRARAFDRDGHVVVLGTRTMTCANASATLPFGTIDTPLQGGAASGTSYVNFGWALTPLPKTIPIDGSTMHVLVDGVDVGAPDYNHARPDIQALFPGLNNTNGAVGFKILDTSTMTNGLHTISWTVADNQGAIEGIGSRFFTVSNGASAVTAASSSVHAEAHASIDLDDVPIDMTSIAGRTGWDLEDQYAVLVPDSYGVTLVRSEEVNRIELLLGEGQQTGYLRTLNGLSPLPAGSRVDPSTNTFTWAPAVGFVGRYDLVFLRSIDGHTVSRREVRVVLQPKGSGGVRK
jgi:Tol biopolymer transport system component